MKWETARLEDLCEFIVDCPHSTAKDEGIGYPLIRTPNIGKGRLVFSNLHRVSEEVYIRRNKRATPKNDDIILAREAPAGNVAIIKNDEKVCLGQRTVLLRPNKKLVCPDYLVYHLLAPKQQYKLLGSANGATVPHVNIPVIKSLCLEMHPLPIQHRIASILSAYDDLIENNRKQIKLLEEAAQRLYKEWFVDFKFPGHEDVKIVDGVPEGWEYVALSDFADVVMGQSPKSEFYNKGKVGLPFHQGVGSYGGRYVIDDVYSTSFTKIANPGSILFSVRAPVGRLNITRNKVVIGRGLSAINHKCDLQSFLFYMLKHTFFRDNLLGNGAIYASISKNELLSQKFLIPSLDLSRNFNDKAMKIDRKIDCLDIQIQQLTEARDRLLPKLMSGEIEV